MLNYVKYIWISMYQIDGYFNISITWTKNTNFQITTKTIVWLFTGRLLKTAIVKFHEAIIQFCNAVIKLGQLLVYTQLILNYEHEKRKI